MLTLNDVDPKDPAGAVFYGFDLTAALNTGATVSSATWNVPGLTVANEGTTSTTVVAKLSGGVHGEDYAVRVVVTTSDGETHPLAGRLRVRDVAKQLG